MRPPDAARPPDGGPGDVQTDLVDRQPETTAHQPFQLFDPLRDEEYEALKADIAKRGVMVPIEVDEAGTILDGHHRSRICAELGVDPPTVVRAGMDEDAKREHVLKLNLLRRHLGPLAWADAFLRLCEVRGVQPGQGKRNDRTSASMAKVAAEIGVSARTARRRLAEATALVQHPDLAEAVDSGEMEAKRALRVMRERVAAELRRAQEDAARRREEQRAGQRWVQEQVFESPRKWLDTKARLVTQGSLHSLHPSWRVTKAVLPWVLRPDAKLPEGIDAAAVEEARRLAGDAVAEANAKLRDVQELLTAADAGLREVEKWLRERLELVAAEPLRRAAESASDEPTIPGGWRGFLVAVDGADCEMADS